MLIHDLIGTTAGIGRAEATKLKFECSQYLREAGGRSLFKQLPTTYPNFNRVKVRLQKKRDDVADVFERAFGNDFNNLRQRSVFAYPSAPPIKEDHDLFFVFPINGYQYMYCREVAQSHDVYKSMVSTMFEQFDDPEHTSDLVADLLKTTYSTERLVEGIDANAEIIFFGIPYYYVARVSACPSYESLLAVVP